MLANLELLEASLEGEDRELAASALRSSRRMRGLVADLLLLARADAGRRLGHEPVDLSQTLREACSEVTPLAVDHELSVPTDVDADGSPPSPQIEGSSDELHRLVRNLLENAVVHTPAGTHVEARLSVADGTATIDVCDDGPGVPEELRGRVFERFVRGETEEGTQAGTGLGLAIVRAVAERHGGSVEVGDAPGGGARFSVRLPLPFGGYVGSEPPAPTPEPAA